MRAAVKGTAAAPSATKRSARVVAGIGGAGGIEAGQQGTGIKADPGRTAELLTHDPLGGGFLAVPGLQQLLGKALEGLKIGRGVDHPGHALQLELLAKGEGERFGHGWRRKGTVGSA